MMDDPRSLHREDAKLIPYRPIKRQETSNPPDTRKTYDSYSVAWICALPIEMAAAQAVLDKVHDRLPLHPNDHNAYALGSIEGHNVAIACLPSNQYGIVNAANVVTNLTRTFTAIRVGLMVGIGGGVPSQVDLRLGDIVVGTRVMQPDLGKIVENGELERTAIPRVPHQSLNTAVSLLRARHELDGSRVPSIVQQMLEDRGFGHPRLPDRLFQADYNHPNPLTDCDLCDQEKLTIRSTRTSKDPLIHYGAIASGNQVIKDSMSRDHVARKLNVICFEMEAAGLMDVLPCLPIRGICDYCDSHKSKEWQKYAAATAAAYARELLGVIPMTETHAGEEKTLIPDTGSQSTLEGRRQALFDSLRFEQMDARKSSIKHAHYKTCRWILTHSEYKAWLDPGRLTEHHGFLWIKGKPGAGKSTIMKYVYLKMRERPRSKKAIASFFFNARGEQLEKTIVGMYRSILHQLLECYPDLQTILDQFDSLPTHRINPIHSLDILKELLNRAILMLGKRHFTCFIDALDECDEQQALDMIQFFEEITEKSTAQQIPLRICFSSRHYPYIIIRWGSRLVLEHQEGHTDDLEAYVYSTLRAKEPEVIERILEKAAGVFMWVALVVEILNREYARGAMFIHRRLEELPSNLSDLFRDIIRRDSENMNELLLCFLWILCAARPLQPEEFYHAIWSGLMLQSGSGHAQPPDTSIQDASGDISRTHRYVISSSKGLAEVTGSNHNKKTVQFIHESIRDFLIKDKGLHELWPDLGFDWEAPSHERLKKCCSAYLTWACERGFTPKLLEGSNHSSSKKPRTPTRVYNRARDLDKLHFLEYACQNILYHANIASQAFSQDEFLSSFHLSNWIGASNLFEKYAARCYTAEASLVYVLADKGHSGLIRTLVKREPQVHIQGERYSYPLFAALARSDRSSFAALLNLPSTIHEGVDLMEGLEKRKDLGDYRKRTPLFWAIENKRTEIAKLLIHRGDAMLEDINQCLLEATKLGNEVIVSLLLERGACPNGIYDGPSTLAIHGHGGVGGAHVNDQGSERLITPLYQACLLGNETVVRILLERGAGVGISGNYGRTALHVASAGDNVEIVKLLLGCGADVKACDTSGQTPLHYACEKSNETIVRLLVKYGSDVKVCDSFGQTPLHYSSERNNKTIVKLLLDCRADVKACDTSGQTPLHYACEKSNVTVVRLLVKYGSDVKACDNSGQTPLHYASSRNIKTIVKLLLGCGADVKACDNSGQTPLHHACEKSNETVVRLLVEHRSDVNVFDSSGQTPLHYASERNSKSIVKLLLGCGADVKACDDSGWTLLHYACEKSNEAIVKLLLDHGSDPNSPDFAGFTPMDIAARQDNEAIVKLLLKYGSNVNVTKR